MSMWERGDAYEPYVGRWSRFVAREFVGWLDVSPGQSWLDVGCGTGALCAAILELAEPTSLIGVDASDDYAAYARERTTDARVEFRLGDALGLPFSEASFDLSVSGLVLNFLPDPRRGLAEMARVTQPEGIVAVYVWDYAGGMQMLRCFFDAAAALDPAASELDEGRRFPICRPDALEQLFTDGGLTDIEVRAIEVPTVFADFDDFWSPFLGGQGPAPSYVTSLSEDQRTALRERLRETLPTQSDGSIHLIARAWAARGQRT